MSYKLTAEQVREAIFNGSGYASFDGAKYYADGIEMQTIADELNAMLGDVEELESKYVELCEQTRMMWTYTQLANVNGKLSDDAAWNAFEFERHLRKLGVIA